MGAYYYPWYGKPGQWGMPYTNRPVLGEYDSRSAAVIAQHKAWADDAGLDSFLASWPGEGSWEDLTLSGTYLLQADVVPLAIQYESTLALLKPPDAPIDFDSELAPGVTRGQRFLEHMDYLADTYFGNSKYYCIDHRPVVVFYLVREWRNYAPYLATLKVNMAAKGFTLYMVADVVWWTDAGAVAWGWPDVAAHFDAITGYNLYDSDQPAVMATFFDSVEGKWTEYRNYADGLGLRFIPGFMPGYDDRALRGGGRPILGRDGGSFFRRYWALSQAFLDADLPLAFVSSFNEWHEGTEMEPSAEYGVLYLALAKELVDCHTRAWVTPAELKEIIGDSHSELNMDVGAMNDFFLKLIARAQDNVAVELGRTFEDEVVPSGVKEVTLRLAANMYNYMLKVRRGPLMQVSEFDVRLVDDSVFTLALKRDLRKYMRRSRALGAL